MFFSINLIQIQNNSDSFDNTTEGKFMLLGDGVNLVRLGLGYIPGIHPHNAPALSMNIQHDTVCIFPGLMEDIYQDMNHKIHGGIMIVQEYHPEFLRFLQPFPDFFG
jgi:hypothetical protein